MRKTFKSLLALTLALILTFGSFTAFAAEENTIEWDFGWWVDEYTYSGEALLGTNTVNFSEDTNYLYFDFTAENPGYYSIAFDYSEIDWACFPSTYANNYATGENISFSVEEETVVTFVSKLEAGSTVLGVDFFNDEIQSSEITIEYLGEAITDLIFDEEKLNDFIDGYDIICRGNEGAMIADTEIVFSAEKSFTLEGIQIGFTCEDFKEGENTVTVKFEDFEKVLTVTAYTVEHYVSDAELSNSESYTEISYDYNGSSDIEYISGESVTVSFTNGKTYVSGIEYGEGIVVFPNGKEYPVAVKYTYNENYEVVLAIYIAGSKINEYKCTETEAGLLDNLDSLKNENDWEKNNFLGDVIYGISSIIYSGSIVSAFEAAREFFFDFFISLSHLSDGLFSNFMYFLRYYFA